MGPKTGVQKWMPEAGNTRGNRLDIGSCSTSADLCRMWTITRRLKIPHHVYIGLGLLCAVL